MSYFVIIIIPLSHLYLLGFHCFQRLTHWGRTTHICVGNLTIIGSDNGLSPGTAPSHYLNQWWNIVNWTLRNKLQWNLNRNSNIFIQENASENVIWKMAAMLSRPQCVKSLDPGRKKKQQVNFHRRRVYLTENIEMSEYIFIEMCVRVHFIIN